MNNALAALPLFATDQQLAVAIVGKERAAIWIKTVIPQLERKGFPRVDPLHDGRPVPLVVKFYEGYFGITAGFAAIDGEERLGQWSKKRNEDKNPENSKTSPDGGRARGSVPGSNASAASRRAGV